MQIRPARREDAHHLHALEQACFTYDQIGLRNFRYLLNRPSARVVVAAEDAELLGYAIILMRSNSRYWRLYSMASAPQARGRGVGKQMLTFLINQAREAQAKGLRLEVKCDNLGAINLYRQLGFEVTDLLPAYYSDKTDGYRMQLSL
ncbi:GNAT family N-acetyltransferase [Aliidiomarina sp. Khilg15.8]